MTGFDSIKVKSPYKIKIVKDIRIECRPNEHGKLYLYGIVDEGANIDTTLSASFEDELHITDNNNGDTIFKGLISNVRTTNTNGVYYVELEAITGSFKLDIEKKSRSFQDVEMEYPKMIKETIKSCSGSGFINTIGDGVKIGNPIFQYKETDWEFIRRMASRLHSVIVSDMAEKSPRFYFGFPKGKSYEIADGAGYTAGKDLYAFMMAGGYEAGFHDTDFFYYDVECGDKYNIGDEILFKNKKLYVSKVNAYTNKGFIRYKYRLSRKEGIYQKEIYNTGLKGVSLEGKVLEVKGELVRIHLNIDKEQPKSKAFWFPFVPPTGNIMYCMPIVDTFTSLYISDVSGDNAVILGCARKNGGSCEKTGNPDIRYLGTEHGSEMEMTPSAISFTGGSKETLKMSLDDSEGITLTSHKKLIFGGTEEISFITPKTITISAASQLCLMKSESSSGFVIENEFHFLSGNVIIDAKDRSPFAAFAQAAPAPAKKSFSWGKLLKNVAIGLAVVAAVTVAAVAIVATAGAATAVIAAVAVGAGIGGTAAVASLAVKDVMRGEVSDASEYAITGAREAFIGAVAGAIFGPAATTTIKGAMALGATSNAFESVLRQRLEGRDLNPLEVLMDAGIGALTGGVFSGGGKLVSWVRGGGQKVASEVAEEAAEKAAKEAAEEAAEKAAKEAAEEAAKEAAEKAAKEAAEKAAKEAAEKAAKEAAEKAAKEAAEKAAKEAAEKAAKEAAEKAAKEAAEKAAKEAAEEAVKEAAEKAAKEAAEKEAKEAAEKAAKEAADGVKKGVLSSEEAEEIAFNAIKGKKNADAIVLGKYDGGGPTAYTEVAKDMDAQYFQLDNWDELAAKYPDDEIWKINEKFLDIQTSSGREVFLSHNPANYIGDGSFYSKEIGYLLDNGYYKFVDEGGIWHAIR